MKRPVRVLIVADERSVREGLHLLLDDERTIDIVGEATNATDGVRYGRMTEADVVLLAMVMPDTDGITATRVLCTSCPSAQVLVLTNVVEDQRIGEVLRAGAWGYLRKDAPKHELVQAITAAADGTPHAAHESCTAFDMLTRRERDVLRLIAQGRNNKEIAAEYHLTEGTVKGYVSAVLAKLEVADRTQAALYAVQHGLR